MSWKKISQSLLRLKNAAKEIRVNAHTDPKAGSSVISLPTDKIPFYSDYSREKCDLRREWVEALTGTKLNYLSRWWCDDANTDLLKGNIELPIGSVTIPVAVAGPLQINGKHADGSFVLPVATTEGALVASITRGARALTLSGGIDVVATHQHVHRAPFFKTGSPEEATRFGKWIRNHLEDIQREVVAKNSRFAKLIDIIPVYDMEFVHLLFSYETGDASGQNMSTLCTWKAMPWIMEKLQNTNEGITIKKIWIEGNLAGDKKSTNFTAVLGRGISVSAKAIIPEEILGKVLNTTSESFYEFNKYVSRISERSNACGFNANVANVLAAAFTACGQDIACVNEASVAKVDIALNTGPEKGIVASLYMPNLMVGSVGGGTNLPTQKECLDIIGCHGIGKSKKLAEIIGSFCLALDLSTLSAIDAGEFSNAHEALGRKT